jgi:hypothetical protein
VRLDIVDRHLLFVHQDRAHRLAESLVRGADDRAKEVLDMYVKSLFYPR